MIFLLVMCVDYGVYIHFDGDTKNDGGYTNKNSLVVKQKKENY